MTISTAEVAAVAPAPPRQCWLVQDPSGQTTAFSFAPNDRNNSGTTTTGYQDFLAQVLDAAVFRSSSSVFSGYAETMIEPSYSDASESMRPSLTLPDDEPEEEPLLVKRRRLSRQAFLICNGKILDETNFDVINNNSCSTLNSDVASVTLRFRLRGGMDRQNRVGSKFGGGGVSSSQQAERERKERLKKLALESFDLAKDPYLVRNHLGSYECKLCLTLHRDEANYLSHTQGKKHQQNLARRAYLEQQQRAKEGTENDTASTAATLAKQQQQLHQQKLTKIKIGRPAYHVFKSRDPETNQRCLSFELHYPDIAADLQPRHRFMSAFEQRVEVPPDRRYQFLLFAAEPYETVAFKIPNEPIDKGENRFVTYWDDETKKFIVTLYFLEADTTKSDGGTNQDAATTTTAAMVAS